MNRDKQDAPTPENTPVQVNPAPPQSQGASPAPESRTHRIEIMPADVPTLRESLLSKYLLLEKIGDGGMGVVYLAQDRQLGRYVAIKRLNRASAKDPSLHKRFLQEARTAAALRHIHIVHIYALGEDADGPYIVMEYVGGSAESSPNKQPPSPYTLADRVHRDGPLPADSALDLAIKLSRAAEYAHSCGVIHRDLKPANVLLDESGEPKIVDFGLARLIHQEEEDPLTLPGEKMLSLGYGAPEQERDASAVDERADIYGLGAILYFSLTGQNPRYFRPDDLPEWLRMPIVKALEPDRTKRWRNVREFMEALLLIKTPSTIEMPTLKRTWRCKWCDTVNPVSLRFCGKCGWDGCETCAECGAEVRVGIPFCGNCGANAREYEGATRLYETLRKYWEKKDFEHIIEKSEAGSAFAPNGPNGQRLIQNVRALQKNAEKALQRRERLKVSIPAELSSRNYEQARQHIAEYKELSLDNPYAEEAARLDQLIAGREMDRVHVAMQTHDWKTAERLCTDILAKVDPQNSDARRLLNILRRRRLRRRVEAGILTAAAAALLYLLSAPALRPLFDESRQDAFLALYHPVAGLYRDSALQPLLQRYCDLWNITPVQLFGATQPSPAETVAPVAPPVPAEPTETVQKVLNGLRTTHEATLKALTSETQRLTSEWARNYQMELGTLQHAMQQSGDFDGWEATQIELNRFEEQQVLDESHMVTEPEALANKQATHLKQWNEISSTSAQKIQKTNQDYLDRLKAMRADYTKTGKMSWAKAVDEEIDRFEDVTHAKEADPKEESAPPPPPPLQETP